MVLRGLSSLSAALLVSLSTAQAAPSAQVNGVTISEQQVEQALENIPQLAQAPNGPRLALESLINAELMLQSARRHGLDKDSGVQAAIDAAIRQVLANAATVRYLRQDPVTDQAIRERYRELVENTPPEQYRVRHIMVASQQEADRIVGQLRQGGSFTELARQSLDADTAGQGGELGWVFPHQLVPEIAATAVNLQPGKVSDPIQTNRGWDILEVMEKRRVVPPKLDEAKDQIRQRLQQEKIQQYLTELRQQANIQVTEKGS